MYEGFGIVTLASALLIGPALASVQFGSGTLMGPFGKAVGSTLNGALGLAGYVLVIGLVAAAVRIFASALGRDLPGRVHRVWRERLGLAMAVGFGAVLAHLIGRPHRLGDASLGGLLGEVTAELLCAVLSTPGTWIVTLSGLALSLVLATDFSWARGALRVWQLAGQRATSAEGALERLGARLHALKGWVAEQIAAPRGTSMTTDAGGAAALPPVVRIDIRDGSERTEEAEAPMPSDLEIGKGRDQSWERGDDSGPPAFDAAELAAALCSDDRDRGDQPDETDDAADIDPSGDRHEADSEGGPADDDGEDEREKPKRAKRARAARKASPAGDEGLTIVKPSRKRKPAAEPDGQVVASREPVPRHEPYEHPPLSLLEDHGEDDDQIDEQAIQQQAARLTKTLADYKILGKVTEVHPGPVVTMYEFVPAPGTRISKIAGLSSDLAMSLHAQRVRIVAPIPGKGAIGIEVPNDHRQIVSFKEIVSDRAFRREKKAKLPLALGKNIFGSPVVMDLAKMPHLLVAGATGAGKSVSVNSMICSLLMRHAPEQVRMILIDPKFLELSGYNDIPHLLLPVVTDPKQANIALRWAVAEMERRYQLLANMKVRDIASYNRKVQRQAAEQADRSAAEDAPGGEAGAQEQPRPEHIPYLVVIIDEFADLMMCASKEVETSVARLAQKARACGIHLIIATQRPSVDVITGLIKANFPSRIGFQVASSHDSKTILGSYGAENLLGAGDMLVLDRGAEMKRLHGAYISDEEIERIIDHLHEQGRPRYDMDILKAPEEDEQQQEDDQPVDELYDKAVALVAESRQASISMVQRRLRIGYNRAARMIERMERDGIVGPSDGVRGREVLVEHHE